jgi:hypothetical protein
MTDVAADDTRVTLYNITFQFKSGRVLRRTLTEQQYEEFIAVPWSTESNLEQITFEFEDDTNVAHPVIINLTELESVDTFSYKTNPKEGF